MAELRKLMRGKVCLRMAIVFGVLLEEKMLDFFKWKMIEND